MESIDKAFKAFKDCLNYMRENENNNTPLEIAASIQNILPKINFKELYQSSLAADNYEFCQIILDFEAFIADIFARAQADMPYQFIIDEKGLYVDIKGGNFGNNVILNGIKYPVIVDVSKESGHTHEVIIGDPQNDFSTTTLWSDPLGNFTPAPTSDNSIAPDFIAANIDFWNCSIKAILKDYYTRH